jgi:hypothetical protein
LIEEVDGGELAAKKLVARLGEHEREVQLTERQQRFLQKYHHMLPPEGEPLYVEPLSSNIPTKEQWMTRPIIGRWKPPCEPWAIGKGIVGGAPRISLTDFHFSVNETGMAYGEQRQRIPPLDKDTSTPIIIDGQEFKCNARYEGTFFKGTNCYHIILANSNIKVFVGRAWEVGRLNNNTKVDFRLMRAFTAGRGLPNMVCTFDGFVAALEIRKVTRSSTVGQALGQQERRDRTTSHQQASCSAALTHQQAAVQKANNPSSLPVPANAHQLDQPTHITPSRYRQLTQQRAHLIPKMPRPRTGQLAVRSATVHATIRSPGHKDLVMAGFTDCGAQVNLLDLPTYSWYLRDRLNARGCHLLYQELTVSPYNDNQHVPAWGVLKKVPLTFRSVTGEEFTIEEDFVVLPSRVPLLLGNPFLHKYEAHFKRTTGKFHMTLGIGSGQQREVQVAGEVLIEMLHPDATREVIADHQIPL